MRRTPSVNARNMLELIMTKSFARPENETRKLASGAKVSTRGQQLPMPFQLQEVEMWGILAPDILPTIMQAVAIPHLRLQILITSLAIWTWIGTEIMGVRDVHENTVLAKRVVTDPVVGELMPIIPMDRHLGPTTAV